MKRSFYLLSFLMIIAFSSCDDISVDEFVLTDENSEKFKFQKKYWAVITYDEKDKKEEKRDKGYILINQASTFSWKKVWTIDVIPFDPTENQQSKYYLRRIPVENDLFLGQLTFYAKSGRQIQLYPYYQKSADEIIIYEIDFGSATEFFNNSAFIKQLDEHVEYHDFDSYAVNLYGPEILEFMKEFSQDPKNFDGNYYRLKGFNSLEDLKTFIKQK